MEIKKKEGESATSLLYRFTKKIQQSGVLKEARKRRFTQRPKNKNKRRVLALKREDRKRDIDHKRKLGLL